MRSKSYRPAVTYEDIQAIATHNRTPHELIPDLSPLNNIESQEDYCNLSVSIISEESSENRVLNNDLIKTIQKSLAELKSEATLYVNSGEKAITETNKKLRETFVSVDSEICDQETLNIINDLRQSITLLNERLEKNEEMFSSKRHENFELKEIVASLEARAKEQSVLDSSKKKSECCCTIV